MNWADYEASGVKVMSEQGVTFSSTPPCVGSWRLPGDGDGGIGFATSHRPALFYRWTMRLVLGWTWKPTQPERGFWAKVWER